MKRLVFALFAANLVIIAFLLWAIEEKIIISLPEGIDLPSILMTSSAIVLTFIGIVIAMFAFFGYTEIRDKAVDIATKAAIEAAEKKAAEVAEPIANRAASGIMSLVGEEPLSSEEADDIARSYGTGGDDGDADGGA